MVTVPLQQVQQGDNMVTVPLQQVQQGDSSTTKGPIRCVISTLDGTTGQGGSGLHQCTVPRCSQSYQTPGWLARHIKPSHGLAVPNYLITPPSAVIADIGLPIRETVSTVILAGGTPSVSACPCVLLWRRRKWLDRCSTKSTSGGQVGCI
jgi:hypothetical protein